MNQDISTEGLQFRILAPAATDVPSTFKHQTVNGALHEMLISDIQTVRGLALRECAPNGSNLMPNGRHVQVIDAESWHILLQNGSGEALGCARYRPLHEGSVLGANHSAIASSDRYGPILRSGLARLFADAQKRDKVCAEAGGWALRREIRGSTAALNIALMMFALAEHLGCGLAITTATRMHHSSSILCRIGAQRLPELPAYYEPGYGSMIEILHFDVPNTNPRFSSKLDKLRSQILELPVICATGYSVHLLPPCHLNVTTPELFLAQ